MTDEADRAGLGRFIAAQARDYETALAEIRAGHKSSHWIWYIFPQIAGLGRSSTAQFYAIADRDEARRYLAHPILGVRLRECCRALAGWAGRRSAEEIFGSVDAMKLRSSMTLFDAVADIGDDDFAKTLKLFYGGERDALTQRILGPG